MIGVHEIPVAKRTPPAVHAWRRKADSDDAALLSAIGRGDRQAYAVLYDRYAAVLLGLIYRILRSRTEAEDVLHDVFLQIWLNGHHYDAARGAPFVWLTRLARNRTLDRREWLASQQRTLHRAGSTIPEGAPDPAEITSAVEDGRRLLRALAEISETQRRVLLLAYFEGLSQAEIAVRIGKPLGTVKSSVRLALGKLRQLLRPRQSGRPDRT